MKCTQVLPPPAPLLRKSFTLRDQPITRAVAFVTGLGYFQLYLNGQQVGDDELVPNQTNYGKPLKWLNLGDWSEPGEPQENRDGYAIYQVGSGEYSFGVP